MNFFRINTIPIYLFENHLIGPTQNPKCMQVTICGRDREFCVRIMDGQIIKIIRIITIYIYGFLRTKRSTVRRYKRVFQSNIFFFFFKIWKSILEECQLMWRGVDWSYVDPCNPTRDFSYSFYNGSIKKFCIHKK